MALPPDLNTRENQKFCETDGNKVAVRTCLDIEAGADPLPVQDRATTPKISNITITASNIEQSHTFVANVKMFMVRPRGNGEVKFSFTATQSGSLYITIKKGAVYKEDKINLAGSTIYFQSPSAGLVLEILEWS